MTHSCPCGTCPGCITRRRRELARKTPSTQPCGVPGCTSGRVTEDCCYEHSLQSSAGKRWLWNDGIIDWMAVATARYGWRTVKLSWVEAEIAIGMMIADGLTFEEIYDRLGINLKSGSPRLAAYERVADAVRAA